MTRLRAAHNPVIGNRHLMALIFGGLSTAQLVLAGRACHAWHTMVRTAPRLWRHLDLRGHPGVTVDDLSRLIMVHAASTVELLMIDQLSCLAVPKILSLLVQARLRLGVFQLRIRQTSARINFEWNVLCQLRGFLAPGARVRWPWANLYIEDSVCHEECTTSHYPIEPSFTINGCAVVLCPDRVNKASQVVVRSRCTSNHCRNAAVYPGVCNHCDERSCRRHLRVCKHDV